jgi:glycosyltransferase involved in cell wall biosynthesis
MSPRVSVVTTVYNCELYVREAIQSILDQTFPDFELIIINDGSTDGTDAIVKSFRDNRIVYQRNTDNKKIPTRRNEAIQRAKGQFVVIQDGDDISLPNRLETQFNFLSNNLDYFCLGSQATKIDLEGRECGVMDYPPGLHPAIEAMIIRKCMNPIIDPTTMFRRHDFLALGGYTLEKSIYTVPDFDLWLRALLSGKKFANFQEPLIKYRVNPAGMTSVHKSEMIQAHMIVWRRFMAKKLNLGSHPVRVENAKR